MQNSGSPLIWFGILMLFISTHVWSQAVTLNPYHKSPLSEPFEKIYIDPTCLVNMPDGLYYYDESGYAEKVKTLRHDYNGFYIVKVEYQCPLCGRVYGDGKPDDDHGCPLFMRQFLPEMWVK